jgi:hypothetical protein
VDACAFKIDKSGAVRAGNISSTSHSIRNYRRPRFSVSQCPLSTAIFSPERPQKPGMAASRACSIVLEGRVAGARSALSTPQRLSSHWATTACQRQMHTHKAATSLPRRFSIATAKTPSWLRNSRQFSASHAPRHGHLDPPRPGEECVTAAYP